MNKVGKLFSKYLFRVLCGGIIFDIIFMINTRQMTPNKLLAGFTFAFFSMLVLSFCRRDDYTYVGTFPVKVEEENSSFVLLKCSTHVYMPFFLKYISPFYYATIYTRYFAVPNCADPKIEIDSIVNIETIRYLSAGICEIQYENAKAIIENPGCAFSYVSEIFAGYKKRFFEDAKRFIDEGSAEVVGNSPFFAVVRSNNDTYGLFPFGARGSNGFLLKGKDADRFISYPEEWAQYVFHSREYQFDISGVTLNKLVSQNTSDNQEYDLVSSNASSKLLTYEFIEKRIHGSKVTTLVFATLIALLAAVSFAAQDRAFFICGIVLFVFAALLLNTGLNKKKIEFVIEKSVITGKSFTPDQDGSDNYYIYLMDGISMVVDESTYNVSQIGDACYAVYIAGKKKPMEIYNRREWELSDELQPYLRGEKDDHLYV